jgi:hypothetical protein
MNVSERAWQVWPLLALAARNRQTLTYEMVSQLTGMATPGLGAVLEPIQSYCLLNKLPALSALVVNKGTGLPGTGFIAAGDVPREFIRVFRQDWSSIACPSPEAFAEAVRLYPSNGTTAPPEERAAAESTYPKAAGQPRAARAASKYQPLREYLAARQDAPHVRLTFAEIEAVIAGGLPESATRHREWWSNQADTAKSPQSAAWQGAGFEVRSVYPSASDGWVEFARKQSNDAVGTRSGAEITA